VPAGDPQRPPLPTLHTVRAAGGLNFQEIG
jgi:hypothetical protein